MNGAVADLVAYRPEQAHRMRVNSILNDLDAELRAARVEYPVRDRRPSSDPAVAAAKSWARSMDFGLALARAEARLSKIGVA